MCVFPCLHMFVYHGSNGYLEDIGAGFDVVGVIAMVRMAVCSHLLSGSLCCADGALWMTSSPHFIAALAAWQVTLWVGSSSVSRPMCTS
jgi:hypothetical protein